MSAACQHSIHNGKDTMFWMARWLDSDIRLVEHAAVSLTDEDLAMSVAKATNEDGNWNWELLCNLLPRNIVYFIAGMEPPGRDTREDEMIWELRATEIGFRIAWDMGLRKVQLQMDSLAAAAAINGETDVNLRHKRTLHNIRELRQRNWETSISHILEKAMLPISLPTMGILLSLVSVLIVITPL
ncbi:hypothetical protein LINPERPRIM_LOCUS55, partial [Linum perenne]